ncbi:hypothetical protein [Pseudomonas moraviensis]|uniref:hypothetical protein n=1 Tax=Pseudomonas moraviensis TaxID=321662 RepID=UPI002092C079|nr:hypothetical protein [Pseudomonas moraviensis]UST66818.1 hypothetical protein NF674_13170 [Pseudomonas moraviensis]
MAEPQPPYPLLPPSSLLNDQARSALPINLEVLQRLEATPKHLHALATWRTGVDFLVRESAKPYQAGARLGLSSRARGLRPQKNRYCLFLAVPINVIVLCRQTLRRWFRSMEKYSLKKELKLNGNQESEPTIYGKTARELALIKFKSGYEDGTIIAQQQHMSSVLGAISFAFFLALFSASTDTLSKPALIASAVLFSASLVSNILIFFLYKTLSGKNEREYIWDIENTTYAGIFKFIALATPILGTFSLILHFSVPAFIFSVAIGLLGVFTFLLANKQITSRLSKLGAYQRSLLHAERDEDYFKSTEHEFKTRPTAEEFCTSKYDYCLKNQEKQLIGFMTLNHQAVVGDVVETAKSGSLSILRIIHSEETTTLICEKDME